MFKGVARFAVYLIVFIPLIVIAVLITKQIQYAFDLRKAVVSGSGAKLPYADLEQIMATNELSTRSFFLIFICFLMILCGLLIILRGTESAFVTSKETKVKYSIRTVYPGLFIAIAGCLLLAYSIYKSSQLQFDTTAQLIEVKTKANQQYAYNSDAIASVYQEDLDTTTTIEAIRQATLAKTYPVSLPKPLQAPKIITPATPVVFKPIEVKEDDEPEENTIDVSADDIAWANELALRSVAFGYFPTKDEIQQYTDISRNAGNNGTGLRLNEDLRWAYSLLLKTKKGYEPTPFELERYESVIGNSVQKTPKKAKKAEVKLANH
jgi:hypothetical protein